MIRQTRRALAVAGIFLFSLLAPALAVAQEFQKVEGRVTDEIPAVPFVGYAYGFIWIAVLAYVVYVARGLSQVNGEIDQLRRKVDGGGGTGGAAGAREAGRR
jgi:CcmD family protein